MICATTDHCVQLTLPNELGFERIAMECSAALAKLHGCPTDRIEDLKTIVAEAAINAMQHGNRWRPDSRVVIRIGVEEDSIHVSVSDEGSGLREEVSTPDIDKIIENDSPAVGYGLFLMRNLADRISFGPITGGGHEVRMTVKMQSKAGIVEQVGKAYGMA